jgi:hypothetical protein
MHSPRRGPRQAEADRLPVAPTTASPASSCPGWRRARPQNAT